MARYLFSDILEEHPTGAISPRRTINVNGITFGPGVAFGGIDFHQYKYLDIAAEERGGVLFLLGFYR